MTFEEALRKAMKIYWDDKEEMESFKGKKYNKKYFDALKEELVPGSEKKDPMKDKKKKDSHGY